MITDRRPRSELASLRAVGITCTGDNHYSGTGLELRAPHLPVVAARIVAPHHGVVGADREPGLLPDIDPVPAVGDLQSGRPRIAATVRPRPPRHHPAGRMHPVVHVIGLRHGPMASAAGVVEAHRASFRFRARACPPPDAAGSKPTGNTLYASLN